MFYFICKLYVSYLRLVLCHQIFIEIYKIELVYSTNYPRFRRKKEHAPSLRGSVVGRVARRRNEGAALRRSVKWILCCLIFRL